MAKELTLFERYLKEFNDVTHCDNCDTLDNDILGDRVIYGCTDANYVEYNPFATVDDGSCSTSVVYGCTNPLATNYDSGANTDDGSCDFNIYGCTDSTASNYNANATHDDGSCIACIWGCTDTNAVNYNPSATCNDKSCIAKVYGCTDSLASNFNAGANTDDGSCLYGTTNCANNATTLIQGIYPVSSYSNYDPNATEDCNGDSLATAGDDSTGPQNSGYDSCCIPCVYGCTGPNSINYDPNATCDDLSCVAQVYGCTNPNAYNYYAGANIDDGSCCLVAGCTDPLATNYNTNACLDDNSCNYCTAYGCTDPVATNYNSTIAASCDDGSCVYSPCTGNASIPDNNFEDYLEANGMGDSIASNNTVLKSNICNVTAINPAVNSYGTISSLEGIEYFQDLELLLIFDHNIEDTHGVSGTWNFNDNINLKEIHLFGGNQNYRVDTLTLDQCVDLEILYLFDANVGASIDVTNNVNLKTIQLTRTDVASLIGLNNCTSLEYLGLGGVGGAWMFNLDLTFTNDLVGVNFSNCFSIGTVTLSSTLDLTQIPAGNFVTSSGGNDNCTGNISVGAGDVPGTSGGTGTGGLQTRVEYMENQHPNSGVNKVTSTNITFII